MEMEEQAQKEKRRAPKGPPQRQNLLLQALKSKKLKKEGRNVTNRHPTDPGWRAAAPHPAHNNQP
jgi:hypothetical protein